VPSHVPLDLNSVIDEIALKCVRDAFIRAVENNACFDEGIRVDLQRRDRGFLILRDDVRLGVIHANRVRITGRDPMYANFLMPGSHWQQVANALRAAEPELVAEWRHQQDAEAAAAVAAAAAKTARRRAAARRSIDQMPSDLAPELINACLDASRRIRLERQVAYERPVILECDIGELTLLPIAGTAPGLLMPFRLNQGMHTLSGELVLNDCDPLPLLIGEDVTDQDAITAWTCALLGFADATCIEIEPTGTSARREPARSQGRPPSPVSHHHHSTQTMPRKRQWPRHLEPIGHWIRYSSSFIAGHRRRLNDGQTASPEARNRARQVGIILHPYETWVRAHTRGLPEDIEIRFLWHAPTELNLSPLE
jgi:hypothetical protein